MYQCLLFFFNYVEPYLIVVLNIAQTNIQVTFVILSIKGKKAMYSSTEFVKKPNWKRKCV